MGCNRGYTSRPFGKKQRLFTRRTASSQVNNPMMRVHLQFVSLLRFTMVAVLLYATRLQAEEPATTSSQIQSLLQSGVHPRLHWGNFADVKAPLEALYQLNGLAPVWTKDGKPTAQAAAMVASLADAGSKGLNPADYDAEPLGLWLNAPELAAGQPQEIAAFDVALSLSSLRYVSNLYLGRVNPRSVNFGLDVAPKKLDLPNLIQQLAQSEQPQALVEQLEPKLPVYQGLKQALAHYRELAKTAEVPKLNFPAKFTPGMRHQDVPALRRWLLTLGDLPEIKPGSEASESYDHDLATAVKSFQQRHGLGADGVIGKGTLAQLTVPIAERIKQIELGLERLRWLPEDVRGLYLIVNIPSFQLYGSRDGEGFGQHDIQMNVIVGDADDGRHTPVFHSDMTYVIFRPYWNVPYQITTKELLPIIRRNPGYLAKNNLEIVGNGGEGGSLEGLASGSSRLRQKPGPKNALGLVKFAFPNTNNVYLHSTPSQNLFQRARRDFSHGCIRVEDPVKLAEWVLADRSAEWPRDKIEAAMKGEKSTTVTLKKPIPVYIFYSTVLADREGKVSFFNDIYGHDQTLQAILAKGFPYSS